MGGIRGNSHMLSQMMNSLSYSVSFSLQCIKHYDQEGLSLSFTVVLLVIISDEGWFASIKSSIEIFILVTCRAS